MLADVTALPIATGALDAVLAAGLLTHLPDPVTGLAELARVSRRGAHLAIFHPSGRVARAARHGRVPRDDDVDAPGPVRASLAAAGWGEVRVDDAAERYLVLATRC